MSYLRVFVLSVLGFLVPVGFSVSLIVLRNDAEERLVPAAPVPVNVVALPDADLQGEGSADTELGGGDSFTVVSQDEALSPKDNNTFVLSFLLRMESLPGVGKRTNLVSKYNREGLAHAGWAVGVRRLATSLRPEVYIRGTDGAGGWLTFSDYRFTPGDWYHFSVVIRKADSVSVFAQRMSAPRTQLLKNGWMSLGEGLQPEGELEFLGGHSIANIPLPIDNEDLVLGAERRGGSKFRGNFAECLVASSGEIPIDIRKLPAILEGGPREIRRRVSPGDIALWISGSGRDESKYARAVQLSEQSPS